MPPALYLVLDFCLGFQFAMDEVHLEGTSLLLYLPADLPKTFPRIKPRLPIEHQLVLNSKLVPYLSLSSQLGDHCLTCLPACPGTTPSAGWFIP
jgi:hypothetical protein